MPIPASWQAVDSPARLSGHIGPSRANERLIRALVAAARFLISAPKSLGFYRCAAEENALACWLNPQTKLSASNSLPRPFESLAAWLLNSGTFDSLISSSAQKCDCEPRKLRRYPVSVLLPFVLLPFPTVTQSNSDTKGLSIPL
jgi:hypothetical protein